MQQKVVSYKLSLGVFDLDDELAELRKEDWIVKQISTAAVGAQPGKNETLWVTLLLEKKE